MPKWGMFKKLNTANTEARLKAFIMVCGLLILIILSLAGTLKATMSAEFCFNCHVMAPEYYTWTASSHRQIACTGCHIEPGLGNFVTHKLSAIKDVTLYFTGTYELPIKMSTKIKDDICTQCHSINRGITPSGDLIIPHDTHAAKKVQCVECHSGVAHGNIAARQITADGNYQVWNPEYGHKQMNKTYAEPKMNTCLACHIKRNVTQKCEACHTSISEPLDHKVKNWNSSHGLKARGDLEYCNKCHSYSLNAKDVPGQYAAARYARGNEFCYNCHQIRPTVHSEDWKIVHKTQTLNGGISGCLICHDYNQDGPRAKAVPAFCAKCHDGAGGGGDGTKTHTPNWRKLHPSVVKEHGATNRGCWDCHDTTHCSKCHLNQLKN